MVALLPSSHPRPLLLSEPILGELRRRITELLRRLSKTFASLGSPLALNNQSHVAVQKAGSVDWTAPALVLYFCVVERDEWDRSSSIVAGASLSISVDSVREKFI